MAWNTFITDSAQELIPLFTLPVVLLVLVAALDNADKQLLSSSFPMLERTFHLSIETLGYFSLFTNLSYALALPFWGWLIHHFGGVRNSHNILSAACFSWGLASLGIAWSGSDISWQAVFRSLNGMSLASILPLTRTMLVEFVPMELRGRAFGFMTLMEQLAGTCAGASAIYFDDWKRPYLVLGGFSVFVSVAVRKKLKIHDVNSDTHEEKAPIQDNEEETGRRAGSTSMKMANILHIMKRIAKIPAFMLLVGQGIFCSVPGGMMSFLLLLWEWRGFTKDEMVMLQFCQGFGLTVGCALGGFLGDYFAHKYYAAAHPRKGRIYVALASVAGGIPLYGLSLFSTNFMPCLVWMTLFSLWSTWTTAGANRPICAELVRNKSNTASDRAQIVAIWIMLENLSSAVLGAPLVGYFTRVMMEEEKTIQNTYNKADTLAYNLFILSTMFWVPCCILWWFMSRMIDEDSEKKRIISGVAEEETIELKIARV